MKKLLLLTFAAPLIFASCQKTPEALVPITQPVVESQTQTGTTEVQSKTETGSVESNSWVVNSWSEAKIQEISQNWDTSTVTIPNSDYIMDVPRFGKKLFTDANSVSTYDPSRTCPYNVCSFDKWEYSIQIGHFDKWTPEENAKNECDNSYKKNSKFKNETFQCVDWPTGWESQIAYYYIQKLDDKVIGISFIWNIQEKEVTQVVDSIRKQKTKENSAIFPDEQIKNILTKIEESTKKQQEQEKNSTGTIIQWDYKAEFMASKESIDDKIVITFNWTSRTFPLPYNAENLKTKQWVASEFESFLRFWTFSPSWHYVSYLTWLASGEGEQVLHLMDIKTWKEVLRHTWSYLSEWTKDKGQFVFNSSYDGLYITKKWDFPNFQQFWGQNHISQMLLDDKYIYTTWISTMTSETIFLKIYDLNTLKEVYSKEIK